MLDRFGRRFAGSLVLILAIAAIFFGVLYLNGRGEGPTDSRLDKDPVLLDGGSEVLLDPVSSGASERVAQESQASGEVGVFVRSRLSGMPLSYGVGGSFDSDLASADLDTPYSVGSPFVYAADRPPRPLRIFSEGYRAVSVSPLEANDGRLEVSLEPERILRGVLLRPGGMPVEAARVLAVPFGEPPSSLDVQAASVEESALELPALMTFSGSDGGFEIAVTSGVRYSIWAAALDAMTVYPIPESRLVEPVILHALVGRIVHVVDEKYRPRRGRLLYGGAVSWGLHSEELKELNLRHPLIALTSLAKYASGDSGMDIYGDRDVQAIIAYSRGEGGAAFPFDYSNASPGYEPVSLESALVAALDSSDFVLKVASQSRSDRWGSIVVRWLSDEEFLEPRGGPLGSLHFYPFEETNGGQAVWKVGARPDLGATSVELPAGLYGLQLHPKSGAFVVPAAPIEIAVGENTTELVDIDLDGLRLVEFFPQNADGSSYVGRLIISCETNMGGHMRKQFLAWDGPPFHTYRVADGASVGTLEVPRNGPPGQALTFDFSISGEGYTSVVFAMDK